MPKITGARVDHVFTTDTGRTVTVTPAAFETTPPWEIAEPHVETFFYATPGGTDPTPLAEIESAFTAAYVNHRLMEIPMHAVYLARKSGSLDPRQHVTVFEDLMDGWEILFATRPGHEFTYEEFKTFLADVRHYLRGEVWWINDEVVYAPTPRDAAIRYLDTHP